MERISDLIQVEFDERHRIVHLTAERTIGVNTEEELTEMCTAVRASLSEFGPDRVYLIVDIARFSIDPGLAESYAKKVAEMAEHFLYSNGMARYGYQITRVTIMLSTAARQSPNEPIFSNKEEALRYIHGLIAERDRRTPEASEEESSEPDDIGEIELSRITFGQVDM